MQTQIQTDWLYNFRLLNSGHIVKIDICLYMLTSKISPKLRKLIIDIIIIVITNKLCS